MERESYTTQQYLKYIRGNRKDISADVRSKFPELKQIVQDTISVADYLFLDGQYSASAAMYERAIRQVGSNSAAARKLEGLATASFYGSARHVQGLKFICRRYAHRPKWDFRFRHAIHAHLRSIAVNLGYDYAESVVWEIRKNPHCQRDDISPVWIPIPLSDMRWMEAGTPPNQVNYGLSREKDLEYSKKYLDQELPFSDYLLFVLGRYDEILNNYGNSYVYDLALLGSGDVSDYEIAIEHLREYIKKYDNNTISALHRIIQLSEGRNDKETIKALASEYSNVLFSKNIKRKLFLEINSTTRVWLPKGKIENINVETLLLMKDYYSDCPSFLDLFKSGKFSELKSIVKYYSDNIEFSTDEEINFQGYFADSESDSSEYYGRCLIEFSKSELKNLDLFLTSIIQLLESNNPQPAYEAGQLYKMCGDIRSIWAPKKHETLKEYGSRCENLESSFRGVRLYNLSFHDIGMRLLRHAYEVSPFDYHHSLYLSALSAKNNENYDSMLDLLNMYADFHPNEVYSDDVLTEIGYYYLAIRGQPEKADKYFLRVVENYPNENAYDNALNWLVVSKRAQGRIVETLRYSSLLISTVVSDRLGETFFERHKKIREEVKLSTLSEKIRFGYDLDGGSFFGFRKDIIIRSLARELDGFELGDQVTSVDGVRPKDLADFLDLIQSARKKNRRSVILSIYRSQTFDRLEIEVPLAFLD